MAKDLNKVMMTGRLGADPEMRFTPGGKAVTSFNIASNRTITRDGEKEDEATWMTCVAWEGLAEICNQYLAKGSRVYVEGRLQNRSWDDPQSGEKRYKTEVVLTDMIMLDSPRRDDGDQPSRPAQPAAARSNQRAQPAPGREPTGARPSGRGAVVPHSRDIAARNAAGPSGRRGVNAGEIEDDDIPF